MNKKKVYITQGNQDQLKDHILCKYLIYYFVRLLKWEESTKITQIHTHKKVFLLFF